MFFFFLIDKHDKLYIFLFSYFSNENFFLDVDDTPDEHTGGDSSKSNSVTSEQSVHSVGVSASSQSSSTNSLPAGTNHKRFGNFPINNRSLVRSSYCKNRLKEQPLKRQLYQLFYNSRLDRKRAFSNTVSSDSEMFELKILLYLYNL